MSKYDNVATENKEPEVLSDWELCRLRDLWISTKKGMIDQGFPDVMRRLEAHKFAEKRGPGFVATDLGRAYIQKRAAKLRVI